MNHPLLAAHGISPGAGYAFMAAYFLFIGVFVIAILAFNIVVHWKIATKAGYNGALSLLMLIPFVNFIVTIVFAFNEWPIERALREATGGSLPPGGYIPPGGGGYAPAPGGAPNINPYANPYPAPAQPPPGYGVPPPPMPPQPVWPPDPPESF